MSPMIDINLLHHHRAFYSVRGDQGFIRHREHSHQGFDILCSLATLLFVLYSVVATAV